MTLGPVFMGLMIDWSELGTAIIIVASFPRPLRSFILRLLRAPGGIEKKAGV